MKKLLFICLIMLASKSMGASTSQTETRDILGTSTNFSGTIGTTFAAIPTVAGKPIAEALIRCSNQSPNTRRLQVSFTSSTGPWITLAPGEFIGWSVKGYKTQIWILGNVAGVEYEIILNREP